VTKSFHAAWIYTALGLVAGLFYREYTKAKDFHGTTQLAVTHTHLLALGMLLFLVVLALTAVLPIGELKVFELFFWFYNAGLVVTVAMMVVHGIIQANGNDDEIPAIAGIAGIGHLLITIGLVQLFLALRQGIMAKQAETASSVTG
jgi:hypothetical protein